jgi:hypothetical protein
MEPGRPTEDRIGFVGRDAQSTEEEAKMIIMKQVEYWPMPPNAVCL